MLTAGAYGGATYYALNDKAFCDTFTTYVPGGEQVIDYIHDLQKNQDLQTYRDQTTSWKSTAQSYVDMARDTASGAYKSTTDAYNSVVNGNEKQPAATTLEGKANKEHVDGKIELANNSTPAESTIDVAIEKPKPILVKKVSSENAVVRELSQVVVELAAILNESGLAGKGRDIITGAEAQIASLDKEYKLLDQEQADVLKQLKQLQQKSAAVEAKLAQFHSDAQAVMNDAHSDTARKIESTRAELVREFEEAREAVKVSFSQLLARELDAQKHQLEKHREEALVQQGADMQRRFVREVKLLVEQERAGRLAKLDQINKRFVALEKDTVLNANELDKSRRHHLMHIALGALQEAAADHKKRPFVEELEAFRTSAQGQQVVETVLASLPADIAQDGVESMSGLVERFEGVADQVRRVALVPEDGGFGSHIISYILAKLMFRKEGLVEGADVEAVLARTKYYLKSRDLENAARQLNQLSGWPKRLAGDWIDAARRHLEFKQALEVTRNK